MVARRLADESVQPASFAFTAENAKWAEWKIGLYPTGRQQSAVIPLLMRAQDQDGWISRATIESIADMLGMAYIRVLEVATFYTQFQLQPVGTRAHVQVCGTTPCMLRGAEALIEVCKSKIHHDAHHLNEDGTLSWEEVECAGACVNAPMVSIFHDTFEDLTAERLGEIIDAFQAGKGDTIKPGPQNDRLTSSAEGGRTTLLDAPSAKRAKFVPPALPDAAPTAAPAAAPQAPTTAAKPKDVSEESAPALKGTPKAAKVSEAKAESERKAAAVSANANGEPNKAMREDATGAESDAGKVDGGKAPGKKSRTIIASNSKPAEAAPTVAAPLFAAPAGAPDDLKLISGVGPVLEGRLNALGITKWSQVAAFTADDIAKVEDTLSFKGRVARDNWLDQAAALAKGGEAEYVRVFGKKPR
jgi:NADH-quinone oxidoreductase subunit E